MSHDFAKIKSGCCDVRCVNCGLMKCTYTEKCWVPHHQYDIYDTSEMITCNEVIMMQVIE